MTSQHTAGKLHVGMLPGPMIYTEDGEEVADCTFENGGDNKANALELVRRWNAFPAMLEALKRIADGMVMGGRSDFTAIDVMLAYQDLARAALKEAQG